MTNRYLDTGTIKDVSGRRVLRPTIYPDIPRKEDDLYVETTPGDRLDLLAKSFYGDVGYYWIIAQANGLGKGTLNVPAGRQLRIPLTLSTIVTIEWFSLYVISD